MPFTAANSKMVVMTQSSFWFDGCSNPGGQGRGSAPVAPLAVTWSARALDRHDGRDMRRASTVAFRQLITGSRVHAVLYHV